jgi:hypothetical protein
MEVKPFRFHKTERANNHIKHSDALFFARNPIGVTDNRLPAMFTIAIHISLKRQGTCHIFTIYPQGVEGIALQQNFYLKQEISLFEPSHR